MAFAKSVEINNFWKIEDFYKQNISNRQKKSRESEKYYIYICICIRVYVYILREREKKETKSLIHHISTIDTKVMFEK